MTTHVVVESPVPNHQNVRVTVQDLNSSTGAWSVSHEVVLTDGQKHEGYIHTHRRFLIEEVPK